MPATAIMVAVLLAPALLALLLDHKPARPVARNMMMFSLAGSVQPLRQMWDTTQGLDVSLAVILNVSNLGTAWISAGCGWLLVELLPIAVRAVLNVSAVTRSARLQALRLRLREEWGDSLGDQ